MPAAFDGVAADDTCCCPCWRRRASDGSAGAGNCWRSGRAATVAGRMFRRPVTADAIRAYDFFWTGGKFFGFMVI